MQAPASMGSSSGSRRKATGGSWEDALLFSDKAFGAAATAEAECFPEIVRQVAFKCLQARSREAVLRVKSFLKSLYGIPNDRCLSFNPDDKVLPDKAKTVPVARYVRGWTRNCHNLTRISTPGINWV